MAGEPKKSEGDRLVLADFLPYRLYTASEKVSLAFSRLYKDEFGLNRPEWRVLAILGQLERATATEIGGLSSMHKTKVSRAVAELERRKWLSRAPDGADRRVEWLSLTKTGRARFAVLSGLARDFEATLKRALGAEAVAHLESGLAALEAARLASPMRQPKKLPAV